MIDSEIAALYAELQTEHILCGLNKCNDRAVDYIVQPWGKGENIEFNLIVPVCADCIGYIGHTEWVLLYCVICNASQWIYKPMAKLKYGSQDVIWMDNCPKCNNMGL